jgi:prefoldin alpha subunit
MNEQEYFMQIQMMGQEAQGIEQQIQVIEQQIMELHAVRGSLEAISKSDGKAEILASLGKGIFVKADLKDKEVFVNVGKDVILKKSPEETIKVIEHETTRMIEGKDMFVSKIQEIQEQMQSMMEEMQNRAGGEHSSSHEHSCGDDCKCEEPCEDCDCKHKEEKQK